MTIESDLRGSRLARRSRAISVGIILLVAIPVGVAAYRSAPFLLGFVLIGVMTLINGALGGWRINVEDDDDGFESMMYGRRINPATGLAMSRGSSVDVGGNIYNTSDDYDQIRAVQKEFASANQLPDSFQ